MLNPARLLASVVFVSQSALAALPFAVAPVKYQMADSGYSTEAAVEAVKQSTVAAQVSGRVAAVNFDAGDYVKAGAVIVRLSAQELSSAVAGSQAQVAQVAATLANARANYERQQQLFQQKFISQAALDKAESEYKVALATVETARAGSVQANTARDFAEIRAPFDGIVVTAAGVGVPLGLLAKTARQNATWMNTAMIWTKSCIQTQMLYARYSLGIMAAMVP